MSLNSKRVARLESLKGAAASGGITCIVRRIIGADGTEIGRIVRPLGQTPDEREANRLTYEASAGGVHEQA